MHDKASSCFPPHDFRLVLRVFIPSRERSACLWVTLWSIFPALECRGVDPSRHGRHWITTSSPRLPQRPREVMASHAGAKAPVVTPRRSYVGLVPACPDGQVGNAPGCFQPVTPLPLLPHPPSWRACARHLVRSRSLRPETVSNRAPSALTGRSSYSSIVLLILWRRGSPPRRLRSPPTAPLVAKHSLANRTQDTARSSATRRADGDSLSTGVAGIALQSGAAVAAAAAAAAATGIRTTSSVTSSRPARAQCMPVQFFNALLLTCFCGRLPLTPQRDCLNHTDHTQVTRFL